MRSALLLLSLLLVFLAACPSTSSYPRSECKSVVAYSSLHDGELRIYEFLIPVSQESAEAPVEAERCENEDSQLQCVGKADIALWEERAIDGVSPTVRNYVKDGYIKVCSIRVLETRKIHEPSKHWGCAKHPEDGKARCTYLKQWR